MIRSLSLPIILLWLLAAVGLGVLSPSLDAVTDKHSVSMSPKGAPAFQAMMNIGHVFKQFDSDSSAMVILEGQDKLGDDAHEFYNRIIGELKADTAHVENVQDFWSDPLTAAGSQSPDGKAAYVQVFLVGAQGTSPSHESVAAVRDTVASVAPPSGVKAYVAGNTVLNADLSVAGHKSLKLMAMVSIGVIFVMLLIVYRSIVTAIVALLIVGVELSAAQGVTATAGNLNVIGLTPYAVSIITMLAIAAGTDYVIFLFGRYHEARSAGEDREQAYYTAYRGVSHVILGSGLTIAGACMCLAMCTLPYFQTMGLPCAIAILVIVAAALTLAPAVLAVVSRFGLVDPKRELSTRGWRKVGTTVVRWPIPIISVTALIAIIGFVSLLTYVPQYNDEKFTPTDMPANVAMAAAALLPSPDEPRIADGRNRPRRAQPRGHARRRSDRQERVPPARHRAGADHHPTPRGADRTQFDPVPDRHAELRHPPNRQVQQRQHGADASDVRRAEQDHRHHGTDVRHHEATRRDHPRHDG
jgi:RND superfamily putative drug exporter